MTAIVHVVVAGEVGGAERMLIDLLRDGSKLHRTSIALATPSARLRALFHSHGFEIDDRGPVREGPFSYLASAFGSDDVCWLKGVLKQRRVSIVHLHTFGSQVLGTRAALATGARILRTEHSSRVYDDPSCWPFSRWSLTHADAVVSISQHVAQTAMRKAPWIATRMRVVANGVDTARFAPPEFEDSRSGRLRFIALGRLDPRKGLDTALAALARVDNAELTVVGEGREKPRLQNLAATLGIADRVTFIGFVEDVRVHLAQADVALSSARAEGLGIALLEAMAMARPVVALPTGGIPEIVTDGSTGWLAQGHEVTSLAAVMRAAVTSRDEVVRRGKNARASVIERYSIGAMCRGYDAVYHSLLNQAPTTEYPRSAR
jgi:glycosyltransferase involved in cell wall biosynthesis